MRALALALYLLLYLALCAFGSVMPCVLGVRGLSLMLPAYVAAFVVFRKLQALEG